MYSHLRCSYYITLRGNTQCLQIIDVSIIYVLCLTYMIDYPGYLLQASVARVYKATFNPYKKLTYISLTHT